jgi:hypothetical protein
MFEGQSISISKISNGFLVCLPTQHNYNVSPIGGVSMEAFVAAGKAIRGDDDDVLTSIKRNNQSEPEQNYTHNLSPLVQFYTFKTFKEVLDFLDYQYNQ